MRYFMRKKITIVTLIFCLPIIQIFCEVNIIDRLTEINGVSSYRSSSNEYICLAYTAFDERTGVDVRIQNVINIDGYIINSKTESFILVYSYTENRVVVFDDQNGPFMAKVVWDLDNNFIVFDYGSSHLSRTFSVYSLDDGKHVVFPYDLWLNLKGNTAHGIWYSNEKKLFAIHYAIPLNNDSRIIETFSKYSVGLKIINWNGDIISNITAIYPEVLKIENFSKSLYYSNNENNQISKIDF